MRVSTVMVLVGGLLAIAMASRPPTKTITVDTLIYVSADQEAERKIRVGRVDFDRQLDSERRRPAVDLATLYPTQLKHLALLNRRSRYPQHSNP